MAEESDEPMQPPSKKNCDCKKERKETKSLFASQVAVVGLNAIYPEKTEMLWYNENANSIYGHQPVRHCYQKEDKSELPTILLELKITSILYNQ